MCPPETLGKEGEGVWGGVEGRNREVGGASDHSGSLPRERLLAVDEA